MQIENSKIAIIGLGYVGLPLAIEFSKKYEIIGFDIDKTRIEQLKDGDDRTNEVSKNLLLDDKLKILFTTDKGKLFDANIYIITVPTPVDKNNKPNLSSIISASELVGKCLEKGDLVIYESTVFPGCTEQICVPILEKESNLRFNTDFYCGYSPERINPGDKVNTLVNIKKIVSASNNEALKLVDKLYCSIILAGTYKASSISVAEAAKVIENTQRDVNIALINELAIIFDIIGISTEEVIAAASTKWNFLSFKPGLVGGHCIGVDPYYLTHKAMEVGYHPEIILAGRRINDKMGHFIAEKTVSQLAKNGINPIGAHVTILGLTFKENCPDMRNTKVTDIFNRLSEFRCNIQVSDSYAQKNEAKALFNIELKRLNKIKNQDALIIAVGHSEYFEFNSLDWERLLKPNGIIIDVKSLYAKDSHLTENYNYWSL